MDYCNGNYNDSTKVRQQKKMQNASWRIQIHEKFGKYKKWMEETTKLGKLWNKANEIHKKKEST